MKSSPLGSRYRSAWTVVRGFQALVLALPATTAAAQELEPIQADFGTLPSPARAEERLLVHFIDHSIGEITAWHWNFGDGTTSDEQSPWHLYLFGNFDVSLTVTGPQGSDTFVFKEAVEVSAIPPSALGTMPVPMPRDLGDFVANRDRAVELGKALFWDVQLGSDGLTACASCHYHAGVDNRPKNTLHPGANGRFDPTVAGRPGGPNALLTAGDFPFTKWFDPNDGLSLVGQTDDRRGAAGMLKTLFQGADASSSVDAGVDLDDGLFQVGGADTLQTTGRDAPTTIGAIFFHRLFWDGRANHFFNGQNIWGNSDPNHPAVLETLPDGSLGAVSVLLDNAAAASQAVGPPLSDVEMSWAGRSWPDLGHKMIGRRPLANQHVDPSDGVLGALAHLGGPGLGSDLTYGDMIQAAFLPRWWSSSTSTPDGFSQMEANFALFFGLAVQCYEATLIPDRAPFDLFRSGNPAALSDAQKEGLSLFLGRGKCITCHDTPVFGGAIRDEVIHNSPEESEGLIERMFIQNTLALPSITFSRDPGPNELPLNFNPYRKPVKIITPDQRVVASTVLPAGQQCPPQGVEEYPLTPTTVVSSAANFRGSVRIVSDGNCGLDLTVAFEWNAFGLPGATYRLEVGGKSFPFEVPQASSQAAYDNGFYNIGVRPSSEDPGVGGEGAFGPLSITRRVQRGEDVGQNTRGGPVLPNERIAVTGSFKTPTLRNVELTGPYMHNGGIATLEEVVEFYARAGDWGEVNYRDKDIDVSGFDLDEEEKANLVAFLESLTDPRVRYEQPPFDHPELPLKAGHQGDELGVAADAQGNGLLALEFRPSTGAQGGPALKRFIDRLAPTITVAVEYETSSVARIGFICDKRPQADVRIALRSSDPALATIQPEVVFTPADWRVTRFANLQRVQAGGPIEVTVRTMDARSTDPEFAGIGVSDVVIDFDSSTDPRIKPADVERVFPNRRR